MEPAQFITEMGWPAALAGAICYMFNQYSVAQTARINALEGLCRDLTVRAQKCEDDRSNLRDELVAVRDEIHALRK
jgi:hypothetical protein